MGRGRVSAPASFLMPDGLQELKPVQGRACAPFALGSPACLLVLLVLCASVREAAERHLLTLVCELQAGCEGAILSRRRSCATKRLVGRSPASRAVTCYVERFKARTYATDSAMTPLRYVERKRLRSIAVPGPPSRATRTREQFLRWESLTTSCCVLRDSVNSVKSLSKVYMTGSSCRCCPNSAAMQSCSTATPPSGKASGSVACEHKGPELRVPRDMAGAPSSMRHSEAEQNPLTACEPLSVRVCARLLDFVSDGTVQAGLSAGL
ncbi:hypothetical protein Efla_002133 [Eimeria flavescens]